MFGSYGVAFIYGGEVVASAWESAYKEYVQGGRREEWNGFK
jgi:hypothetical protein